MWGICRNGDLRSAVVVGLHRNSLKNLPHTLFAPLFDTLFDNLFDTLFDTLFNAVFNTFSNFSTLQLFFCEKCFTFLLLIFRINIFHIFGVFNFSTFVSFFTS